MITIITPKFINTAVFTEEGRKWYNERKYCEYPEGTKKYFDYWDEQKNRCLKGYTVGDVHITGYHYFYLNFSPIKRAVTQPDGSVIKDICPPDFYDYDWVFFKNIQRCEDEGKHMAVLKARRKGYSYKVGAMLARNYALIHHSDNYAMAYQEEYLVKDGLLNKCWHTIDHLDKYTAFAQPRLVNQKMHKKAGMTEMINGSEVEIGMQSQVIGVSMKDDPNKARGKAGKLGIYEEAGRFPNLTTAWEINSPSYEQGIYKLGLQILFGTGGAKDVDFEGLEKMFYDPDTYDLLAFENIWDDGAKGKACCFFVPAYEHLEGFVDKDGNSDTASAKAHFEVIRKRKTEAKDLEALGQHKREFPWTPREALSQAGNNIFPVEMLQAHLDYVEAGKRFNQMANGRLVTEGDKIKFAVDINSKPILKFPHSQNSNLDGAISILEAPIRDNNGNVPDDQYIIIHDPYAIDTSDTTSPTLSLGAAYVVKLPSVESPTLNGCIVASYVARPYLLSTYNEQLFALADYYNAKIGFESNRGKVRDYALAEKKLHRLFADIDIIEKKQRNKRSNSVQYGITMNTDLKVKAQQYLREWLLMPVKQGVDGNIKRRLHYILDTALLQELIKFNPKGNFDRVSALLVGMFYIEEIKIRGTRKPSDAEQQMRDEFFLEMEHFA